MSLGVSLREVTVRYGRTTALDAVDLEIRPGVITGLLGRNGSGKTTMVSAVAGFLPVNGGEIRVGGQDPWENERTAPAIALVRESGDVLAYESIHRNLSLAAAARPTFSLDLAHHLLDVFELDPRRRPSKLSRGKRSAFGIVLGVAGRAPLTILDEVHLGLDVPSRYAFYDALLADYLEHPRTVILASHLIGEVERLLEDVVILEHGRVLLAQEADTLRTAGVAVTGPAAAVDAFAAGRRAVGWQRLGGTARVTVVGHVADADATAAVAAGLDLGPVPLQDLVVHLTSQEAPA